jgi:hypothetical protein
MHFPLGRISLAPSRGLRAPWRITHTKSWTRRRRITALGRARTKTNKVRRCVWPAFTGASAGPPILPFPSAGQFFCPEPMSASGGKADTAYCSAKSANDPKRTLKFNFENKNGAALKPRQVVMRNTMNHAACCRDNWAGCNSGIGR